MSNQRRGFLSQIAVSMLAVAGLPASMRAAQNNISRTAAPESWLAGLHGQHRQFFDVPVVNSGSPLLRTASFLNAYAEAYDLHDSDVNVVFGAHGAGLSFVLNDEVWSRFKLGAYYGIEDPATKLPATRNIFSGVGALPSIVEPSIAALQTRGVRFLGCMQSVKRVSRVLADKTGLPEATVKDAILAAFLPGVTLVPAMIVAANRAQETGLTYAYLG